MGLIDLLVKMLNSEPKRLKEVFWCINNIMCGEAKVCDEMMRYDKVWSAIPKIIADYTMAPLQKEIAIL